MTSVDDATAPATAAAATDGAPDASTDTPDATQQLRDHWDSASRHLPGHGARDPDVHLERIAAVIADHDGTVVDHYGDGGIVATLEDEVAALLGKDAGVFLPSGTMAQQATLRVHADRAGCTTVGWHPRCHLDLWEEQAATHLHGLVPRRLGSADAVLTRADFDDVADPFGAILWELPQRDLGGVLPEWDDLVAQVDWARDRGIATHLDGARLWMVPPHYGRDLADVAGLFDTVYVSMYKDLGGLPGCVLAGPDDVLEQVRTWRHRHGGTLHAMWPQAASGMAGLRRHLPRMAAYAAHARALAGAVTDVDGVHVVPDPPHTSMFHLWLDVDPKVLHRRLVAWAQQSDLATWIGPDPAPLPGWSVLELGVGDATMDVDPAEFRDLVKFMLTEQDRSD